MRKKGCRYDSRLGTKRFLAFFHELFLGKNINPDAVDVSFQHGDEVNRDLKDHQGKTSKKSDYIDSVIFGSYIFIRSSV